MAFNFKNLFRKSKDPTPIKQETTVENFCKNQGIFPNLQVEKIVKEEFI